MSDLREHLGCKIRFYRDRLGISQEALSQAIGVTKQTIWRWETGKGWPEYEHLSALATMLDIEPDAFFADLDPAPVAPTPQEALRVLEELVSGNSRGIKDRPESKPVTLSPLQEVLMERLPLINDDEIRGFLSYLGEPGSQSNADVDPAKKTRHMK